jgi:hypothetical protein
MACARVLLLAIALCVLPSLDASGVSFKSLGNATIAVRGSKYNPVTNTTSPLVNQTVRYEEFIQVSWNPLPTAKLLPEFTTAHVKLCYGPASAKNRGWRKSIDDISLDRLCKHKIIDAPWKNGTTTVIYQLEKNLPRAFYRFRIYALNAAGDPIAYGQTNTSSLFYFDAISGRSVGLDVAIGVLSAVSGLVLVGYFIKEQSSKKAVKG